ncbi:MAG TPA: Xaa-Pro peptidase family protein [Chthoniobacterales bacterium]|jgi:Xaa-Pro aminopeptidase
MATPTTRLIVASSESSADLRYATKFLVGDAVIFLEQKGKRTLVLSDLEIDRGKREAAVDEIVALSAINKKLRPSGPEPTFRESVAEFLRSKRVTKVLVPEDFPLGLAQFLGAEGITLSVQPGLFYPEREFKSAGELKLIRHALKITETGMARGIEVLQTSEIRKSNSLVWAGKTLTSETLRAEIDSAILRAGGLPANTIVAGGNQACDPHERGSGRLKANSLIILDIFPRDAKTGYFGDLTRTVVRGRASDAQRQLWDTVLEGQKLALRKMKPGVDGDALHNEVKVLFTNSGYPTEQQNGRWSGFFHGTGHGLGLEIHEIPRFSRTTFQPGQVLTVEPGLYYHGIGGVRHEDVVTITETGVKLLSTHPKPLEI